MILEVRQIMRVRKTIKIVNSVSYSTKVNSFFLFSHFVITSQLFITTTTMIINPLYLENGDSWYETPGKPSLHSDGNEYIFGYRAALLVGR